MHTAQPSRAAARRAKRRAAAAAATATVGVDDDHQQRAILKTAALDVNDAAPAAEEHVEQHSAMRSNSIASSSSSNKTAQTADDINDNNDDVESISSAHGGDDTAVNSSDNTVALDDNAHIVDVTNDNDDDDDDDEMFDSGSQYVDSTHSTSPTRQPTPSAMSDVEKSNNIHNDTNNIVDDSVSHTSQDDSAPLADAKVTTPAAAVAPNSEIASDAAADADDEPDVETNEDAESDGVADATTDVALATDTAVATPVDEAIENVERSSGVLPVLTTQLPAVVIKKPYKPKYAVDPVNISQEAISAGSHPKAVQFNERIDYLVTEFFQQQASRIASKTPEKVDRFQRFFTQRLGEAFGSQWAHVTAQPEVDDAIRAIEDASAYAASLETLIGKQATALQMLSASENDLFLFFQQKGNPDHYTPLESSLIDISTELSSTIRRRVRLIKELEKVLTYLKNFTFFAVNDCKTAIKQQRQARVEFDSYASKLGHLEEKAFKALQAKGTDREKAYKYQLEELELCRTRFQNSKLKYQMLSTQVIDKAAILEKKKNGDMKDNIDSMNALLKTWYSFDVNSSVQPSSPVDFSPSNAV